MGQKKTKIIVLVLLIVVVTVAVLAGIFLYGGDARKLREQINLGQKYLSEMNYEEALVAFNQAISLDPRRCLYGPWRQRCGL